MYTQGIQTFQPSQMAVNRSGESIKLRKASFKGGSGLKGQMNFNNELF